ncbi:MAG: hypothetical protein ACK4SY_06460 [Pyrobaculum sp.]
MTLEHKYADTVYVIALLGIMVIIMSTAFEAITNSAAFMEKVGGIFGGKVKEDPSIGRIGVYIFATAPLVGLLYIILWSLSKRYIILTLKAVIIFIVIILAIAGLVKVHI